MDVRLPTSPDLLTHLFVQPQHLLIELQNALIASLQLHDRLAALDVDDCELQEEKEQKAMAFTPSSVFHVSASRNATAFLCNPRHTCDQYLAEQLPVHKNHLPQLVVQFPCR